MLIKCVAQVEPFKGESDTRKVIQLAHVIMAGQICLTTKWCRVYPQSRAYIEVGKVKLGAGHEGPKGE